MSAASTSGSGPRWFSGPRRWLAVLALALTAFLAMGMGLRWQEARARRPADLGPGPVPGVRLTTEPPVAVGCRGVTPDQPPVRLVAQIDVDRLVVCLGPGRLPYGASAGPLSPYALTPADSDRAADLLDAWAAAWSLPDQMPPWWAAPDRVSCPSIGLPVYPVSVTVTGQTVRPVPPQDGCGPREQAWSVMAEISREARLAQSR